MDYSNEKSIINNEYDNSNILPAIEYITYLAEYCDGVYKQFIKMTEEDEEKNKQFKQEYKEYNYKKNYGASFEISIREKSYNNINCEDIQTFKTAIADGNLKSVNGLDIKLDLDFKRGKGDNLEEHDNSFSILFKPYEIKFARKSNHNDGQMNQIENNINEILKKFPIANSIFCDKKGM